MPGLAETQITKAMKQGILLIATIAALTAEAIAADDFVDGELLISFQPGTRGALADGIRNGLRGLTGRLQRGLDPAGMLAMPNTSDLAAEIANGLGADPREVLKLTNALHTGGIWENAARLAAAEDPAVLTWMVLAHLTAEGEKRPDEFIHDFTRLVRDLNEAATDPNAAAEAAKQELVARAKDQFVLSDGVPVSTSDAFLQMAILGYRYGIVQSENDLFVAAKELDFSILERKQLLPVERQDRGRTVTFYINDKGQDVVKKLYDGFGIVLNGDLELAKDLAKTAERPKPPPTPIQLLADQIAMVVFTEHASGLSDLEKGREIRSLLWDTLVHENPGQTYPLRELQRLFERVDNAKRQSRPELEAQVEAQFSHIEDETSRSLLATLLWDQLIFADKDRLPLHADNETELVLKELGLNTFARQLDAKVTPQALIATILADPRKLH